MSKTRLAISFSSLLVAQLCTFAWAAEPTNNSSAKTDASSASAPADSIATSKHGHDHPFAKKLVLGLSSLTAKQKEQINAIYDGNSKQWQDLEKQMRDLREAEWTKIKPILTADQLTQLHETHKAAHAANKGKESGGDSAPKAGDTN
ncbi:MAG TPA: hypothetical protein V6C97_03810 [Oculatellaceae cyanobacterium]